MKNMFQRNPPFLQALVMLQKLRQIGPSPIKGAIFQKMKRASMQVGQILMIRCITLPIQNLVKFLTFFSCYSMPSVTINPPTQKKVSTAKQAAGARVVIPGFVRISRLSVQFLMLDNLNHISWPQMIQEMDRTLTPLMKRRFQFQCCLGMVTTFMKFSQMLKDLRTLTGLDSLLVTKLATEPKTPKKMRKTTTAMTIQLLQSIQGLLVSGLQTLRLTNGTKVVLVAFWKASLSCSSIFLENLLLAIYQEQSRGAHRPMFWMPRATLLMTVIVKYSYQFLLQRQLLQSPRSLRNLPESVQEMAGKVSGCLSQESIRSLHLSSWWVVARSMAINMKLKRCVIVLQFLFAQIFHLINSQQMERRRPGCEDVEEGRRQKHVLLEREGLEKDNGQEEIKETYQMDYSVERLYDQKIQNVVSQSNPVLQQATSSQNQTPIFKQLRTENLLDVHNFPHPQLFKQTTYPWEALQRLPAYLQKIISSVPTNERNKAKIVGSVYIDEKVVIGQGSVIEHGAMIKGPAFIGRNCEIRKGAYIRGNVLIGDGSLIGNSCEIKGSIIFQKCEIAHFNYVGDSILGTKAHLAAGAITSNLKLDSSQISIKIGDRVLNTKMTKLGAIIGWRAQIGCNAVLNPGSIISSQSMLYAGINFRGYLPSQHMVKLVQEQQIVKLRK